MNSVRIASLKISGSLYENYRQIIFLHLYNIPCVWLITLICVLNKIKKKNLIYLIKWQRKESLGLHFMRWLKQVRMTYLNDILRAIYQVSVVHWYVIWLRSWWQVQTPDRVRICSLSLSKIYNSLYNCLHLSKSGSGHLFFPPLKSPVFSSRHY